MNDKLVYDDAYFDETTKNLAQGKPEKTYFPKLDKVSEHFLIDFTKDVAELIKQRTIKTSTTSNGFGFTSLSEIEASR